MAAPKILRDMLPILRQEIDEAVDFVISEFDSDFEKGDRYANGEVDLPTNEGRSKVVSTQVRDAIRNIKPSLMRVLTGTRKGLVRYIPSSVGMAQVVEQQEQYVQQLFWKSGGYKFISDMVDESLHHRIAAVKTYFEKNPAPVYASLTMLTQEELMQLDEAPDIEILEVEKLTPKVELADGAEEVALYNVEYVQTASNGAIVMEVIPYGEFFINRNARDVPTSRIHGHRRSVTVAEAIEMGLDCPDWSALDDENPETARVSGVAKERRLYQPHEEDADRDDTLSHTFLLTEAYVKLDLLDAGFEQTYVLLLGGTSYRYLDHYRVQESDFDIARHDPRAFTVFGTSIPDITVQQQDVMTSMLRGMVDNVHLANTPRFGGNPSQVNFDDLNNHQFGYPIRFKGTGTQVQVVQVPSQIQSTLPMLQWMEQDSQNKIGITKAAQGLDPNAMQSTDKQAVQNTIQLSQGQVELMARNLIETGLIPVFRKLLRLSVQHLDRLQIVRMRGAFVPVDTLLFCPDWYAETQVGLGTVPEQQKQLGLQATMQQQMAVMDKYGPGNPFVSFSQIYNTLEDLTESYGLYNVSRYWNAVTPEVEQAYAEQKKQEAIAMEQAKKQQPQGSDPALALIEVEKIKSATTKDTNVTKLRTESMNAQLKALDMAAKDDLARDQMAQDRVLKLIELKAKEETESQKITAEQDAPRDSPYESAG
jgi:hypothetical protein